jgi:hypothetical protein
LARNSSHALPLILQNPSTFYAEQSAFLQLSYGNAGLRSELPGISFALLINGPISPQFNIL